MRLPCPDYIDRFWGLMRRTSYGGGELGLGDYPNPRTRTGGLWFFDVPSPIMPKKLSPQQVIPSEVITPQVCSEVDVIALIFLTPGTARGMREVFALVAPPS